jgi:hypothetical protein
MRIYNTATQVTGTVCNMVDPEHLRWLFPTGSLPLIISYQYLQLIISHQYLPLIIS